MFMNVSNVGPSRHLYLASAFILARVFSDKRCSLYDVVEGTLLAISRSLNILRVTHVPHNYSIIMDSWRLMVKDFIVVG